ncbi:PilZ domain-containing protein [Acidithiobacillus sp. CV18-2]|uniref:PilZ domain-containing protein n=1 Tax=Igneacidithiobacillus copahuensis TaxID=2724909 RepID=A0AAE2YNT4_9PROT|nr:PilZ domain-containing protein [Igneacidithiobacillus copahuensis]MBU2754417.1 PilZ domain-containing protein [Acidithiobacillus sp. CV18-3]MBU2757560.1 PilZ domain-containing protein [Acidithiobacillus sp. BN09-2]MBU2777125.1 PilZ domain-containing protein [Acidithiobacillus sp. CV18-2]MBU2797438.1 PilZ domain-containing protein [Acidithiobacillus sp. VAN18-2]MBU2799724.1 PilZ domain-containing protein [Acidithiobacillus sp. VAN18-4]UTV81891.1 PilZ domain-containing protein [Acidithiobaci
MPVEHHLIETLFQEKYRQGETAARRLSTALLQQPSWTILAGTSGRAAESEILDILPEGHGLLLDPWPGLPDRLEGVGELLLLVGALAGIPTGFVVRYLGMSQWRRYPAVHLTMPEQVYQWQRRAFLRAPAPADCRGQIQRLGARALPMELLDLGAGGLRVRVAPPRDYALSVEERFSAVSFSFAGERYALAATLRHLGGPRRVAGAVVQELGLAFASPPQALQEQLLQYALRYDREALHRARL